MAGNDSQKQLLTLIRNFASEKSQGEKRVVGLRKQIEQLRSELDASNAELEQAKRLKEVTEQEIKGYEVELALNDASIQALEARNSLIQDEISSIGSEVDGLKNEEGALREKFISLMFGLNSNIRKFYETIACNVQEENCTGTTAEIDHKVGNELVPEVDINTLEDMLSHVLSQTAKEEQEYIAEENIQKQIQQEYFDIQRKISLLEEITKETKALQELSRQSTEFEEACAAIGEVLQNRCVCPSCHMDNVKVLGDVLQARGAN